MSKWGTEALRRQNIAGAARAGAHGISRRVAEASARSLTLWALGAVAAASAIVAAVTLGTVHVQHEAPAFLQRSLGAAAPAASLVRVSEDGIRTGVTPVGLSFKAASGARMTLASEDVTKPGAAPQPWTRHANGTFRQTSFGNEAVVFNAAGQIEQLMTVGKHVGQKTWSWRLASTLGTPRVGSDGYVAFIRNHAVRQDIVIKPVVLFDARHQDITPAGARWSLARDGKGWLLLLKLNDKGFPLPYVIDPITFTNSTTTTATAVTSIASVNKPVGVADGDLALANVSSSNNVGASINFKTGTTAFAAVKNTSQNPPTSTHLIMFARILQAGNAAATWSLTDSGCVSDGQAASDCNGDSGVSATPLAQNWAISTAAFTNVASGATAGQPGIDITNAANASGTAPTIANPAQNNEVVVWGFSARQNSALALGGGSPGTLGSAANTNSGSNDTATLLAYSIGSTAGSSITGANVGAPATFPLATSMSFRISDVAVPTKTDSTFVVASNSTITFDFDDGSGVGVAPTVPVPSRFVAHVAVPGGGTTNYIATGASIVTSGSTGTVTLTFSGTPFANPGNVTLDYTNTNTSTTTSANFTTSGGVTIPVAATGTNFQAAPNKVLITGNSTGSLGIAYLYNYTAKAATSFTVTAQSQLVGAIGSGSTVSNRLQDRNGNPLAIFSGQAVYSAGAGSITVSPNEVASGSTQALTFTYTVPPSGMSGGEVWIDFSTAVGQGWTAPQNGAGAGQISSLSGTGSAGASITVAGSNVVKITNVTATSGQTLVFSYGTGGGNNPTAPSPLAPGLTSQFSTTQKSLAALTMANVATQPSVGVTIAPDGSGTMGIVANSDTAGHTGQTFTLTFQAPASPATPMNNGEVDVVIPSGWTAPNLTLGTAGRVKASCQSPSPINCTVSLTGNTIKVTGLTLTANQTFTITYGDTAGGGSGVTVPDTPGQTDTFLTTQRSLVASTLTQLATQPTVNITGIDGSGTMAVTNTPVYVSTVNSHVFTFTLGTGGMFNGSIDVTVPAAWPAPQESDATAANYVLLGAGTASVNTLSISSRTITIDGITGSAGQTVIFTYGDTSGGATAVTEPASPQIGTFATRSKASSGGSFQAIAADPTITVMQDGSGTMTVSPNSALANNTADTFTFTYTASATGMSNGKVSVTVPTGNGWTAPQTSSSTSPGFVSLSNCGGCSIDLTSSPQITITGVTKSGGGTFDIVFGNGTGGNPNTGTTYGANSFPAKQQALSTGSLAALAASPSVTINAAADGATSCTLSPTTVAASSQQELTFTCTLATGGMNSGAIELTIPSGWTAPQTGTNTAAGYVNPTPTGTATSVGTASASGQVITVTGITGTGGQTVIVKYGNTTSNANPTAKTTAQSTAGTANFGIKDKATSGGTLTTNTNSPRQITVTGIDGEGACVVSPTTATVSTGYEMAFTCTIGASGMVGGAFEVDVPASWGAPQTSTNTAAGYTVATGGTAGVLGTLGVSGQLITVSGITGTVGQTVTFNFGDDGVNVSAHAVAPATTGTTNYGVKSKGSSGGTLTTTATSPLAVTVVGTDGAGACVVSPTSVVRSVADTLTFTCTIGTGGMLLGGFEITIPAGWTAPQTTTSGSAGYTKVDGTSTASPSGTISASGQVITVTGVTGASGATVVVKYGDISGGAGGKATPPATAGANTIATKSKGGSGGTFTATATSPLTVNVTGTDGAGNCTVSPTSVVRSTPSTLTFTCTIGTGGMLLGGFELTIPAGWTAPQTTTSGSAGYTKVDGTSTASPSGTISASGQVVTVTGVTGAAGATVVVIYGDTSGGVGGKATPPGTSGPTTVTTKSKGGTGGTFTPTSTSPLTVNVDGTDGAGTCTVSPLTAATSSAITLTFTCTIGTGGMNAGAFTIAIPSGWTAPQTGSTSSAGYTKVVTGSSTATTPGTASAALQVITVSGITGTAGQTVVVSYGDTTGNAGGIATSGPTAGVNNIAVQSKGGATGTLTTISSSPLAVTLGGDGQGSCSVSPTTATSSTPVELTFTCTLGGTMTAGAFQVGIPATWTTPQTGTPTAAGYTALTGGNATSTGSLAVAGQNVNITGVTGTVGQTVIFKYGYTGVGGVNTGAKAVPPATPESSPFPTKQKSTAGGTLTTTSPTPTVTVASGVIINPPKPKKGTVDGDVVVIEFDDEIDASGCAPAKTAFRVISSVTGEHTVLSVSLTSGGVVLTIDPPITPGEIAHAIYTGPSSCKLKGKNGKDVDDFDQPLDNKGKSTGTGSTPVGIPIATGGGADSCDAADLFFMSAAYGSKSTVTLVFCRVFDERVVSDTSAFQVSISSKGRQVPSKVVVRGQTVLLTIDTPLAVGDTAVVSYAQPVDRALVDKLKNKALPFMGAEVINLTGGSTATGTGSGSGSGTGSNPTGGPRLSASSPDDGITVPKMKNITLASDKPVQWKNVVVTLADGRQIKLPDGSGTTYSAPFSPTIRGPYTVNADMIDDKGNKSPAEANFSVYTPPPAPTVASAGNAPEVNKVTKVGVGGAIVASDGSASVAWPSTLFKERTIVTVEPLPVVDSPKGVPSITANFAFGSIAINVQARRASNGAVIKELDTPLHLEFPNGTPGGAPAYSQNGMTWTYLKLLAKNELPDGVRDGYFRDAQNTVHVWTRHLTYFAILKPGPALKLIAAPHIWAINKRRTIAFLIQTGRPVSGVAQLYVAHSRHNVTLWKPFKVKAGATVIRMYLPKNHKMLGKYELRAKFKLAGGKRAIRKRTIDFLPKRYVPAKKPIVVRINGLDNHINLAKTLRKFNRVGYFKTGPTSIPFVAIAKKKVDAVVIDSTRSPYDYNNRIGLIRNLRWIFPDLRIVVITSNKTMQAKALQWGGDAVSKAPGGSYQLKLTLKRAMASRK